MDQDKFAELYEQNYEKAVMAAMAAGMARDVAEDGVQQAALEFMESGRASVTPALFIRRAVDRAKDAQRPRGVRHGDGRPAVEVSVGGSDELEAVEHAAFRFRTGVDLGTRVKPHPRQDDVSGGDDL